MIAYLKFRFAWIACILFGSLGNVRSSGRGLREASAGQQPACPLSSMKEAPSELARGEITARGGQGCFFSKQGQDFTCLWIDCSSCR